MRNYFDCVIIGDVFLDVMVLMKRKNWNYGGTSYCDHIRMFLGGAGNVAVGLSILGGEVAFLGKSGHDKIGRSYKENLVSKGVFPRIFTDSENATGMTVVSVDNCGERSILVFRGANDNLTIEEIETARDIILNSRYLYFSGYSLVNNPQQKAILAAANLARKYGIKTVFDPAAYNLIESNRQLFKKVMNQSDIIVLNMDEAQALTDTVKRETIINELRKFSSFIALKCGEDGCIICRHKDILEIQSFPIKCLDTTGAGDAFAAGLIYGLSKDLPLKSVGVLANWFASRMVLHLGPRSFPSKPETTRFLEDLIQTKPTKPERQLHACAERID